jgi:hypothetical protein
MERRASDLFDGPKVLRATIVSRIREARMRTGAAAECVAATFRLANDDTLRQLEAGTVPFRENLQNILSVMILLKVPLEEVMPLPKFSPAELEYWTDRMRERNAGPLAAAGGVNVCTISYMELFIRTEALYELE